MHQHSTRGDGLCLLSLDAGGPRGVAQLKILAELMHRLNFGAADDDLDRPCSIFDMIGGTGRGGFIAILLVVLGLTAEGALHEFIALSVEVLEIDIADAGARTASLRRYIDSLLKRHGLVEDQRLFSPNYRSKGCKLVVPISYKDHVGTTFNLRNFDSRQELALNLTIAEAMLITLATPPLFTPISISKDAATFGFISGDLILSNPTREIIAEAYGTFGSEERVACLLSLGSGHRGPVGLPSESSWIAWNVCLEHLATDSEQKAQNIVSQMGHLGIYYRFRVSEGLGIATQIVETDLGSILSHTAVYLGDALVSQKLDSCVDSLKTSDGLASLDQLSEFLTATVDTSTHVYLEHSGGQTVLPSPLPRVTKAFVMRREPWKFIEKVILGTVDPESVGGPRVLVVTGMGGCGKTQIVLKFMEVYKDKFASRSFIDSSSKIRIRADIIRHVRSLGPGHSQKSFEDCLRFLAQPSLTGPRLMLYDNVNDPSLELAPLLPHGSSCVVIITSRNRLIGELCPDAHLELGLMSMDEAAELLLQSTTVTNQERQDVDAIAEALGCLPIALQQARSYMSQTQCSFGAYLKRLHKGRDKLLAQETKHQLDMRSISTYAAFDASFDRLAPHTKMLLRILSFFHWRNFPLELITLAAKYNFLDYEHTYITQGDEYHTGKGVLGQIFFLDGEWDVTHLDEMMVSLQNYSLVTLVSGVDTMLLQIHPLIHGWVQFCMTEAERDKYQSGAILLLALGARKRYTPSAQYLISHVTHLSPVWDRLHVNDAVAFGNILRRGGLFSDALHLQRRAVAELRAQIGPRSVSLLVSLWSLALTYSELGRFTEAMVLQEEVLTLRKETLGEGHPDTIMTSNNLAGTYRDLGRYHEAKQLQEESLRLVKEVLGELHPETVIASSNLAFTYRSLGRFDEAKQLQEEVLKWRKERFGERHPDTILASSDLAITYRDLGRYQEAEQLQEEVLRVRKGILGERHPDTIMASHNLALTNWSMGRFKEAERLQEEVLMLNKEILGQHHLDTVMASSNLALTYWSLARFDEAEQLQEEVLRLRKEKLGELHPDTTIASSNLAITYHDLGRYQEAEQLQEEVLRVRKGALGERHPDTIMASSNLANTYRDLGLYQQAGQLQEEVLQLRKEILGKRHPDTISASNNLALIYRDLGRYREAERLQKEVLELWKEVLGERHPDSIMASSNLAITYHDLGQFQEAERLQQESLKVMKEVLGEHHPDTLASSSSLANTYTALGKLDRASVLEEDVLKLSKKILGDRHPRTLAASNNLAWTYRSLEMLDQAEKLQLETLQLSEEILGNRHPDTTNAMLTLAAIYESLHKNSDALRLLSEAEAIISSTLGKDNSQYLEYKETLARVQDLPDTSNPGKPSTPHGNSVTVSSPTHPGASKRRSRVSRFLDRLRNGFSRL